MEYLEKLRKMMMVELKEIAKQGQMTASDLEEIYKITCSIKCLDKIVMVESIKAD